MGKYINKTSKGKILLATGKVEALVFDGAFLTIPAWKENLVCVIDNGNFEAAGYAYCENEFNEFNRSDGRLKTWLVYKHAKN